MNKLFKKAAEGELKGILGVSEEPLVSSDYNGNIHSATVDLSLTMVNKNQVKVVAWYDNETGYSNRMIGLTKYILGKDS